MVNIQERVTQQYAEFPYPARDPGDETHRLIGTWLDDLGLINHHCFRGERRFDRGFSVLVAGGGTGDGTIFLAEQLRGTKSRIVHLDVSEPSIAIARERARRRGLSDIEWVNGSLVDLPHLGLGSFSYINCVGVLHHLESPERGLDALLTALAPDGALGLMVYGQIGRTGVYQLQSLLRTLDAGSQDIALRLAHTRAVLASLPSSNWFKRGEALHPDHRTGGDAGVVDLLLHPRDRAYTVPQLYAWLEDECGLYLDFTDVHRGRLPYTPERVLAGADDALLAALGALPRRDREAIAELAGGDLITHSFFATRSAHCAAPYRDADYVPFFIVEEDSARGEELAGLIAQHGNAPFLLRHGRSGLTMPIECGRYVQRIFGHLDGRRSWGEIFAGVRRDLPLESPTDEALFADFEPWYDALRSIDRLLLHRSSIVPTVDR